MSTDGPKTPRTQIGRARKLRRNSTGPERALWKLLRNRNLRGLKFRRQHPVGPYFVDFFCHACRLVVEVDGQSHDGRGIKDRRRTIFLEQQGLRVLRISNDDVVQDPESVLLAIARAAGIDVQLWMNSELVETDSISPHPGPLPEGEGE